MYYRCDKYTVLLTDPRVTKLLHDSGETTHLPTTTVGIYISTVNARVVEISTCRILIRLYPHAGIHNSINY